MSSVLHFTPVTKVLFPIHHTFGPLVTKEQWRSAFRLQFQPWKWREGSEREELRRELSQSFACSAALFGSGRDALLAALRALELKPGEEVILQGLTCVVIPNAIHAAQGVAVYCDIDPQTLNMDVERIQRLITPRTRAIICQHTFGIPTDTVRLRSICSKRGLVLIEDCAHVIPHSSSSDGMGNVTDRASAGSGIGEQGDILIFSFGRDKAISGVTGGAALSRHPSIAQKLMQMERDARQFSLLSILHHLGYPLRYSLAKRCWKFGVGKAYLRVSRALGFLPPVLTEAEKQGKVDIEIHALPNALATLALQQLHFIGSFNTNRHLLANLFREAAEKEGWSYPRGVDASPALQKFPLFAENPTAIRERLKREQVYLDDGWCGAVVNPPSVPQDAAGYMAGSCPAAEDIARHLLTLPLHPTMDEDQVRYLIHALRSELRPSSQKT